ncbi:protein takeout-like [Anoplophora glabripennis]|uniref:protein takeout-like n=1 Tax=Anoplophora glabripennis TaxID=217634 RepID=UPI0008748DE8|nr:protein takeout-like [Anoplophora glabripennis]
MIFLLGLVFGVAVVSGAHLPDGVKLCHRSDPDFQKCVAKSLGESLKYFTNGYKELGIPPLKPLFIEKLEIDPEAKQSVSIQQKYHNINVHGITDSTFDKYFKIELDNGCSWVTDASTPVVRMEADYEIKGQLLVFPINSHGKCNITQYDVVDRHMMTCEKYTKNNEIYLRVVNYTMDINSESIVYDFDSIFPGNEQISNEIAKTLNENSLSIFNEVKGGIEKAFSFVYMQYMNNVFSRIPLNQIFLD